MSDFFEDYKTRASFSNEKIKVKGNLLTSCFSDCYNLEEAPMLNTSKVTSMRFMFAGTNYPSKMKIKTIPKYNTSNVTDMAYMFDGAGSIESLPMLDTSKVIDMRGFLCYGNLFSANGDKTVKHEGCPIENIPLFDTSNVIDMSFMFVGCYKLKSVPHFNTSKVQYMVEMFARCTSMNTIPPFDTSNCKYMTGMFAGCERSYSEGYNNKTEYIYNNFTYIPELNTSKAIDMTRMFAYNQALTSIDWEIDCSSINSDGCANMFQKCNSLSGVIKFKNVPASMVHQFTKEKLGNCGTYTIEIVNTIDK